mmetsp:Transcript_9371/g.15098  ORF Transcript_9371/g.15098 Transcript_9371/m.15098 type:complete len:320 (+) Transcript_9371:66-1025(+)
MAAAAALNVVKQIEALADSPDTPNMSECLGQLVTSLQFFLEHPDSRVRLGAGRTLLKLSKGHPDEFRKSDLSKAKSALARCRAASSDSDGEPDAETLELSQFLKEFLEEAASATSQAKGSGAIASDTPAASSKDGRGEVVLKVGDAADDTTKAAISRKVVTVVGVVSIAFEGDLVIVNTRTPEIAADPVFIKDLLEAISEEGIEGVTTAKRPGEVGEGIEDPEPAIVDDEDYEPEYVDDDEDEAPAPLPAPGSPPGMPPGANWSFFAQSNWMTGRRVTEYDEDPSIAARLAKAKQKQEEKKKQQESRLGSLARWMGMRS